jgi:multisubunit Na+/H+ antiporter MnhG subunit
MMRRRAHAWAFVALGALLALAGVLGLAAFAQGYQQGAGVSSYGPLGNLLVLLGAGLLLALFGARRLRS